MLHRLIHGLLSIGYVLKAPLIVNDGFGGCGIGHDKAEGKVFVYCLLVGHGGDWVFMDVIVMPYCLLLGHEGMTAAWTRLICHTVYSWGI